MVETAIGYVFQTEVDRYLAAQDARWEQLQKESEVAHGPLLNKLRARRRTTSDPEGTV
jgi:hypothetical protein